MPRSGKIAPIIHKKCAVKVETARFVDIPTIHRTAQDAFANDPLYNYLRNTPDAEPLAPGKSSTFYQRLLAYIELGYYVLYQAMLTINQGEAFVTINRPGRGKTQCAMERFIRDIMVRTATVEQRKRWTELSNKLTAATNDAFGGDLAKMLRIVDLATAPENQGKGYGYALMASANAEADKIGCASWLLSSNVANTPFYKSCGYVVVKEVLLGENNPTWMEPPFPVLIMARAASSQTWNTVGTRSSLRQ
ncbi:hypothetical protein DAEQUDRAFT_504852 [Daedalea quercina L-15889]|uniref:N-acetyltransferase domain-containing protein n=1 Tax=Daedalea quercina L-15889 TaxID=1314783 RepID=A0A165T806_9APHY|nr:hypothetical protein DAEQUDRAFT_504852 [Daedalea quercina L-15889]